MPREMHLIGYMAVPTCHFAGLWRHPFTATDQLLDRRLYQSVARTLEEGLFDMVFMPDSISVPDTYGGDFKATLQYGSQGALQPDPMIALTVMAGATNHLGLGATISTSYVAPYNIARMLSTLDHFSGGRAAWNIVTSTALSLARNFNSDRVLPSTERYDRADEVVEVVTGLWDSWEPDALKLDTETAEFADADKVHYLNHVGEYMSVRGPLSLPRSAQGHPVLMQAGASERGLRFGARWGELIFAIEHSEEDMRALRQTLRAGAAAQGRDPETIKLAPAVQIVLGETEQIAKERLSYMRELVPLTSAMALLSAHSGVDLSTLPGWTPLEEIIADIGGVQGKGTARLLAQAQAKGMQTLEEAAREFGTSELTPEIVGTPAQVAEQLAHMFK